MPGVVVGYKNHISVGMNSEFTNPTVVNIGIDPCLERSLQGTYHEIPQDISVANQDIVPFFA